MNCVKKNFFFKFGSLVSAVCITPQRHVNDERKYFKYKMLIN